MGFSFQSLGQLGLLQSLLGAAPAGQGGTFPTNGASRSAFGTFLQHASGADEAPALAASPLKATPGPALVSPAGELDGSLSPSVIFFNDLAADQDLLAAPYGLDTAYDPIGTQTDFLSAAIATPQAAFNTKVATALRTNTIKSLQQTVSLPIEARPVAAATVNPTAVQDAQPVLPALPVAAADIFSPSSDQASDIEELPEALVLEASADEIGTPTAIIVPVPVDVPVEAAALTLSATAVPSAVAGPTTAAASSPGAPLLRTHEQVTAAASLDDAAATVDVEALAGVVTARTPAEALAHGRPLARTARQSGDAEQANAALTKDKRDDIENPAAKAEPADKETGRRTLAEADTRTERKAGAANTTEQSGTPIRPESPQAHPVVSHKSAEPAAVAVAPVATSQAAPASPAPERPVHERAHPATAQDQVGTAVARAARDGSTEIHVRLDPVELGRVEVRLQFQADGEVRAQVTTDNPQTFDLLRRDSQALERALQDAGLKTDSGSLSFNLRQQDHQAGQQEFARNYKNSNEPGQSTRPESPALAALESPQRGRQPTSLFDVLA